MGLTLAVLLRTSLLNDKLVETELLCSALEHLLLNGVLDEGESAAAQCGSQVGRTSVTKRNT